MPRLIPLIVIAVAIYFWLKARKAKKATGAHGSAGRVSNGDVAKAAAKLGLVPADRLDVEMIAPETPERKAVRAAVAAGDWKAAAAFAEEAGRDWHQRTRRITLLADLAVKDDDWLRAWLREQPQDPAANAVNASALVYVAWEIRGNLRAKATSSEQFDGFHRVLAQARAAFAKAQELAGDDPSPFIGELPLAMGLGLPHEYVEELWAEIEKRDPYHLTAHTNALQYWCAKWRGSHEAMHEFARRAAARGGEGRLLTLLPLEAYFEEETHESDIDPQSFYSRPEVVAATDAALADVAAATALMDPRDGRILMVRHMLAWMLFWQDRYEEALEQYREIDGYIGCAPWTYSSDPKDRYTNTRDYTAAQIVKARSL
ncbi:hypothetical protein ACIPPS_11630 [Streptomyces sp. NPDC090127]|uniref:hypothetical protein n=1 Tax=Streptomyces sp. NPDC090127 TaxID=3365953 RepID=UPI0037FD64C4